MPMQTYGVLHFTAFTLGVLVVVAVGILAVAAVIYGLTSGIASHNAMIGGVIAHLAGFILVVILVVSWWTTRGAWGELYSGKGFGAFMGGFFALIGAIVLPFVGRIGDKKSDVTT